MSTPKAHCPNVACSARSQRNQLEEMPHLPASPSLLAYPEASVEVGTETFEVTASVVHGAERDQFYARQVAVTPAFGDYE